MVSVLTNYIDSKSRIWLIKLLLLSQLLCSSFFLLGNTSIDSLRTQLITDALKHYQNNDEVFQLTYTLAANHPFTTVEEILKDIPSSPQKAFTISYLAFHTFNFDPKLAAKYMKMARRIAEQYNQPKLWYWINRHQAFVSHAFENHEEAIQYLNLSNGHAISLNFERGRIINLVHFAENYAALGNDEKSFEYAYLNLQTRKDLEPDFDFAYAYHYLGYLYNKIEDHEESYNQYSKAQAVYRQIGSRTYEGIMIKQKVISLTNQNLLDSAIILSNQAKVIFEELENKVFQSETYQLLAEIYFNKKEYKAALEHLIIADSFYLPKSEQKYKYGLDPQYGNIYLALNQYELAEKHFLRFLNFNKSESQNSSLLHSYNNLASLYLQKGDFKKARTAALSAIENSKYSNIKLQLLQALQYLQEAQFQLKEYEKNHLIQQRISTLNKDIQLDLKKKNAANLKLKYYFRDKSDALEANSLLAKKGQNWRKKIIAIVALGFIIISFLLLQIIRISRKRNKSLLIKNKEIAQLNEMLETKVNKRTKALKEQTKVLNNYFDNLPGVAYRFLCNADFTPVFISKNCIDLFGYKPNFILHSQTSRNLIHPKYHHEVIKKVNDFVKRNDKEEVLELIHPIITKNSGTKWVMNRCKLLINPNEKKYLDGIFLDITDQMITEAALKINQAELSLIYNNTQDFMGLIKVSDDDQLIIESVNKPYIQYLVNKNFIKKGHSLTGLTLKNLLGDILHMSKEKFNKRIEYFHKVKLDKKIFQYESKVPLTSGGHDIFNVTLTPIIKKDNSVCSRIIFVLHDITAQKKAQKALKRSENQLSTIYNASQDLIALIKKDTSGQFIIESINQSSIEFLKKVGMSVTVDFFQGIKMKTLFSKAFNLSEKLVSERMKMMDQVFLDNKTFKYKSIFKPKGSPISLDFETIISPIIDADGKCTQALYTARDITESEIAKSKLLSSQKRLLSIFNGANDQMAFLDVCPNGDFILEDSNLSFQKNWEGLKMPYELRTFYGKDIKRYLSKAMRFSEKEVNERIKLLNQVVTNKVPVTYEDTFKGFDNNKYILDVSISSILDKENNCKKLLFIFRDVTLKHKAKERMISKILETEDRERSRFAKELHDSLGQNLTVASLNFNFVKKNIKDLDEGIQKKFEAGFNFLNEAIQESRHIAHNLMPQAISDFGYVLAIESLLDNLTQTTDIKFTFYDNLKGKRLPEDHELSLYRITQEAINNILKHADAKEVTIQLIKHKDSIILTIEDDGKGFLLEDHKKKSFGLNSMRNRASALSGVLDIGGAIGKGTSITLEIPV